MTSTTVPLGITCGDPAGVGPEVALRAAAAVPAQGSLVVYGDAERLLRLAQRLGLADRVRPCEANEAPEGRVGLVHVGTWSDMALVPRPTAEGGAVQFSCLEQAISDALGGRIGGLVTGPMSKAAVNLAGQPFVGHTEHLALRSDLGSDDVTMMFLGPRLRLALVTTHLAVRDVPQAITPRRVARSILHLGQTLVKLDSPAGYPRGRRLVVAGLNPHAGEGGLFGDEEEQAIVPAIMQLRRQAPFVDDVQLEGPMPAETAIRLAAEGHVAGVVAMMHDQATIPSKALDWGAAVNVTWGLPFVRTSVDHGVGYDAVVENRVDPSGMEAAIRMAQRLTTSAVVRG